MPFPALVQGVLWEPGPPDNSPQKARVMLANVAAGEALNQGVKRKSDQIEDAGSRPVSSRDWPLQENRVVGNNEKSHDDSRARDGENSSIPIDVEEIRNSAPSISADVKESRASYTTSHPAASTEAPEDYREAIESESEELRLTEKEVRTVRVC